MRATDGDSDHHGGAQPVGEHVGFDGDRAGSMTDRRETSTRQDTSRLRFDSDSQHLDLSSMALKSQHPAL